MRVTARSTLSVSFALSILNAAIVGVTNADALIDDIQSAAAWTRGDCDIWSSSSLGVMIVVSLASVGLALAAKPATATKGPSRKLALIVAGILVLYWVGVATLGGATCIEN